MPSKIVFKNEGDINIFMAKIFEYSPNQIFELMVFLNQKNDPEILDLRRNNKQYMKEYI